MNDNYKLSEDIAIDIKKNKNALPKVSKIIIVIAAIMFIFNLLFPGLFTIYPCTPMMITPTNHSTECGDSACTFDVDDYDIMETRPVHAVDSMPIIDY